jgi:hypothetical protein
MAKQTASGTESRSTPSPSAARDVRGQPPVRGARAGHRRAVVRRADLALVNLLRATSGPIGSPRGGRRACGGRGAEVAQRGSDKHLHYSRGVTVEEMRQASIALMQLVPTESS